MKYFFRRTVPSPQNILLMESGSPVVAGRALEGIRKIFPSARYHLCTCWPDPPSGLFASVFRVTDYPSSWDKLRLLWSYRQRGWEVLVILCTGEPILWRWKMAALFLLPAKVLIVNENADFFWLDWGNWKTFRRFLAIRWGVNQEELLQTAARGAVFPFTLLVLLATAGWLYARRWRRPLARRLSRLRAKNQDDAQDASLVRDAPRFKLR